MRIAIVSDAWAPQVNGVATTLSRLVEVLRGLGHEVLLLTPDRFAGVPVPGEPGMRFSLVSTARLVDELTRFAPDALHIATEGPLGWRARSAARRLGLLFTSAYHTCFPEYLEKRLRVPASVGYRALRRFHSSSQRILVPNETLRDGLRARGFERLELWGRGVDAEHFRPGHSWVFAGLPRPVFLAVGRLAPEKNLEAFLSLPLPGSKVVVGDGPQARSLRARFPDAHFVGAVDHIGLATYYQDADVFVFPSRTDTFGLVMLEAMACGTPVAAFPEAAPRTVLDAGAGVMDEDLGLACRRALDLDPAAVRAHACRFTWEAVGERFLALLAVPARTQAWPKKRSDKAWLKRITAS